MQTRKRNIDSVLNLVNPKRVKLVKANQKKETEKATKTVLNKKGTQTPVVKGKHTKKQETVDNRREHDDNIKESPKIDDTVKKTGKTNNDNKDDSHIVNKPLKKRPLLTDKSPETVVGSKENKSTNNVAVKTVRIVPIVKIKDKSTHSLLTNINQENKDVCHRGIGFSKPNIDKETVDKITNVKLANNVSVKVEAVKADVNKASLTENAKKVYSHVPNIDVKVQPNTTAKSKLSEKLDQSEVTLEPVPENEDDEYIDAGAIEDDRDADFVIPKKEEKGTITEYNDDSYHSTKTNPVNVLDVRTIKIDAKKDKFNVKKLKYICTYCEKDFKTKYRLEKHIVRHTGDKPYKCEKCDMRFGLNTYLKRHMDVHLEDSEKPFACNACPKVFSRKSSLEVHQVSHQAEKPFSCTICFKKFKRKLTLIYHSKVHKHGKMYICHFCGKSFGFRSSLEGHIQKHSDVKPYVCELCGKGFYSKQSYYDHNLRHKKIKDIECNICKRRYYNIKELKKHMVYHNNTTNFSCEPCQMYFKDEHCRRIHTVKCHKKEYTCDFCELKFYSQRLMKTHIFREHRELRNSRRNKMPLREKANFKHVLCDFCGKELSNKYRLKSHLLSKHSGMKRKRKSQDPNKVKDPVKPYPSGLKVLCTICNKIMYNKYKLFAHMEKVHDIPMDEIPKIELVPLEEGVFLDAETGLEQKIGSDIDVQTIVIKPAASDSNEYGSLSEHGGQYEGSTVHYLDAHGNIIYTDASGEKVLLHDYIKLDYNSAESNQDGVNISTSEPTLIEAGSNGAVSLLTKGQRNVDFSKNIVDFAAQAAKIIDVDEGIISHKTEKAEQLVNEKGQQIMVSFNKTSNDADNTSSASSSNVQDITYIVQQAASRIAAHELTESSQSLLNLNGDESNEIKLIVNDVENIEGVIEGYSEENVKYIIEETVDTNVNVNNLGYVVKEEQSEYPSDVVLAGSSDADQQQKIIIIDEQGGEQVISTGPSEQIKIIYDPETGLYTYLAEEVVDQQEEENNAEQQLTTNGNYNFVILNEEDLEVQKSKEILEIPSQNSQSATQESENEVFNAQTNDDQSIPGFDNKVVGQFIDKAMVDPPISSLSNSVQDNQAITVASVGDGDTCVDSTGIKVEMPFQQHHDPTTHIYTVPASNNKSSEYSAMSPSEIHTPINVEQTQHSQLFAGVESSSTLSSHPTMTVPSESGSYEYQYLDQDKQSQSFVQHGYIDTESAVTINESSTQMLEDINQGDLSLKQTSETLKTDFLNMGTVDTMSCDYEHSEELINAENIIIHTKDDNHEQHEACLSNDTDMENDDMSNKKDLIQLENILKSGIKEVSNTVEYSSFLDRMIDHLQNAKENVIVPEKEIQTNPINESSS